MLPAFPPQEELAALVTGVTEMMLGISFKPAVFSDAGPWRWRTAVLPIKGAVPITVGLSSDEPGCAALGAAMFSCDRATLNSLKDDQAYLLGERLEPLVQAHGFSGIRALVGAVCGATGAPALQMQVVDALTTHETFFFRDAAFWRALEEVVVPRLLADGRTHLRVWSLGCSHGQEAYSVAMLLDERWPALAVTSSILGTDVSAPAVARAKEGVYSVLEVNRGLGAARLLRHFQRSRQGGFAVRPALRGRVAWEVRSLLEAPSADAWDVILCRNVLIYFSEAERAAALARLIAALRPGGFLGLGISEIAPFQPAAPGWFRAPATCLPG